LNLAEEIFITVASMTEETLTSRASPSNGIEIFYCKGPFKLHFLAYFRPPPLPHVSFGDTGSDPPGGFATVSPNDTKGRGGSTEMSHVNFFCLYLN
jgi:hypothetical protein